METRTIGNLDVSVLGLGCNNFGGKLDAKATEAVVHTALDHGVTYFELSQIHFDVSTTRLLRILRSKEKMAIRPGMRKMSIAEVMISRILLTSRLRTDT